MVLVQYFNTGVWNPTDREHHGTDDTHHDTSVLPLPLLLPRLLRSDYSDDITIAHGDDDTRDDRHCEQYHGVHDVDLVSQLRFNHRRKHPQHGKTAEEDRGQPTACNEEERSTSRVELNVTEGPFDADVPIGADENQIAHGRNHVEADDGATEHRALDTVIATTTILTRSHSQPYKKITGAQGDDEERLRLAELPIGEEHVDDDCISEDDDEVLAG